MLLYLSNYLSAVCCLEIFQTSSPKPLRHYIFNFIWRLLITAADDSQAISGFIFSKNLRGGGGGGGGTGGFGPPPPLKNHKLSNTGPGPMKNHQATKPAFNIGTSWHLNGILLAGCWWPSFSAFWILSACPLHKKKKKKKNGVRVGSLLVQRMKMKSKCHQIIIRLQS